MTLLSVYLLALGFGATLLLASLVMGGKDVDGDADGDADDGDGDHAGGGLDVWAMARSLRFWTFLLTFGGAVGLLLRAVGMGDGVFAAMVAGAVGLVVGVGATWLVKTTARPATSTVTARELAGASGSVLVAVAAGGLGKIRVEAKGRALDLLAETDDGEPIPVGAEVLIVAGGPDGRVQVTRAVR